MDPSGAIAIPVVLGGIWAAIEFGLLVYDIYDTATTLMDPCASDIDKALSVTGLLSGAILPGGGYGTAGKAVRKCSFTAETPVLMCDGSHRAIKEVRQGDLVLAQHKETGEVACREVQSRSANPNQAIILVTLESPDGTTEVIETTENHPFYVEGRGWTRVDELVPGDLVPSATNGILVVSALEWTDRAEIVYNFGVDEFHTYFVGEVGAWVHNCDQYFKTYEQARNAALDWLVDRGFRAEKAKLGKFGPNSGKPIGMQSHNEKIGFRVEHDVRSGAHINVWSGKEEAPHFIFEASESTVNNIVKRFGR